MTRKGHWMQSFTGRQFWPLDPRVEDVCIEDIAHALSQLCRFGGHCREFYSVAQHSVWVACQLPETLRAQGLMHDATECYLIDLPRPIKRAFGEYRALERRWAEVIGLRYGLELVVLPPEVHEADNRMLKTEQRDLMANEPSQWEGNYQPYPAIIGPWTPKLAEQTFLSWAKCYGIK